ncbi:unnamed protein product [Moneuplotes crassus]|uniref:Uncharacterized protein n=1 Tax=Euplotes crassus TaxID=5936 RepID=A0AAD1Y6G9_EUPCR|nr:unnamed protein product [Moneuplotes crassus]
MRPLTGKAREIKKFSSTRNSLLCLKGKDATTSKLKKIQTNGSTLESGINRSIQNLKMRSSFTSGFWSTKHSKNFQEKSRNVLQAHRSFNEKLKMMTQKDFKASMKTPTSNTQKVQAKVTKRVEKEGKTESEGRERGPGGRKRSEEERKGVESVSRSFCEEKEEGNGQESGRSMECAPLLLGDTISAHNKDKRLSVKGQKFKFGEKKASVKKKIKVFKPKKPLFSTIKLTNGVKYICRLNNHLTNEEIVNHLSFSENLRIKPNSFVMRKALKNPPISSKDVCNKVVYDYVRRKDYKKSKKPKKVSKGVHQSELQMLNVLLPKDKQKKARKTNDINDRNKENPTISRKELGESNYEDWFECKKHDLTSTIPINYDHNVKNTAIRLLLKQLGSIIDALDVEYENLYTEVDYLEELNNIVHSYTTSMEQAIESSKKTNFQTTIFNGKEFAKKGITKSVTAKDEYKDKLNIQLKVIIEKKYLISTHIEKAMILFDIVKKKKILAESDTDIKISKNIYGITKSVVKQMAEEFQFVEREMNKIVDEILESNMPSKP